MPDLSIFIPIAAVVTTIVGGATIVVGLYRGTKWLLPRVGRLTPSRDKTFQFARWFPIVITAVAANLLAAFLIAAVQNAMDGSLIEWLGGATRVEVEQLRDRVGEVEQLRDRVGEMEGTRRRSTTAGLPAGTLVRFIEGRGCPDDGDWRTVYVMVTRSDETYLPYCEKQRPTE